jgi:hypothetical protein
MTPQDMLPPTMKLSPPNMSFSSITVRARTTSRTRCPRVSSYAMIALPDRQGLAAGLHQPVTFSSGCIRPMTVPCGSVT